MVDAATLQGMTPDELQGVDYEIAFDTISTYDSLVEAEVVCPPGKVAVGGGGLVNSLYALTMSAPTGDGSGWFVVYASMDFYEHPVDVTVVATCASPDAGATAMSTRVPDDVRHEYLASLRSRVGERQRD